MSEKKGLSMTMSVDLKKFCIRVHKPCYRMLGEPRYIQLLVNPKDMVVAIRGVEKALSHDSIHKINEKRMLSGNSYEIYSRTFVRKLCEIADGIDEGFSYKLSGEGFPDKKTVVFYLKTLQKTDRHGVTIDD